VSPPTPASAAERCIAPVSTGPHVAVDRYGRPSGRPRWLAPGTEYLALLERQGRGVGVIYLLHFDRPIGDPTNPRGYAATTPVGRWTCPPGWSTTPPVVVPG
jgi:hypothetical protein